MYIRFKQIPLSLPIQCVERATQLSITFYLILLDGSQRDMLRETGISFSSGRADADQITWSNPHFDVRWFNYHCDTWTIRYMGRSSDNLSSADRYYGWLYIDGEGKENEHFLVQAEFKSNEEAYQALPLYTGVD